MINNKINQFIRKTIAIIGTDHIINNLRKPDRYLMITNTHRKIPAIFIKIKIIHHSSLLSQSSKDSSGSANKGQQYERSRLDIVHSKSGS